MGQNFLIDRRALGKILQAAELSEKDTVLEIGPGLGVLTKELARRAGRVVAVEKDSRLCQILKDIFTAHKNVEIIQGDILKILGVKLPNRLPDRTYKIVANIPYYLTSPLIRKFLEIEQPLQMMVLMVQKEVAQRICAKPPRMNLLAVSVQFYSQPKIISYVSKKSFWPQPKVDSAILSLRGGHRRRPTKQSRAQFFCLVRAGFSCPRKQLANNLSKKLNLDREQIKKALTQCGLNPQVRAENLSVEEWEKLSSYLTYPL